MRGDSEHAREQAQVMKWCKSHRARTVFQADVVGGVRFDEMRRGDGALTIAGRDARVLSLIGQLQRAPACGKPQRCFLDVEVGCATRGSLCQLAEDAELRERWHAPALQRVSL